MDRFLATGLILFFGLNFVWAKTEKKFFLLGKSLELRPPPGVPTIENIIWKHKDNLAAEWAKGDSEVTIYGRFKDRANLDKITGFLKISNTTAEDTGAYTVDINGVLQDSTYDAIAIKEVPKPTVWVRPDGEDYQLTCDGSVENAEPVIYMWRIREDEEWIEVGQKVTIHKNETMQRVKTFSCKMKNPVSEKESDPADNPWLKEENTGNPALGALAVIPIAIIIALGIAAYVYKDTLRAKWNNHRGRGGQSENRGAVTPNETSVPLKDKEENGG